MPLIYYLCECGGAVNKFFRQAKDAPAVFSCLKCEKSAKKILKAPSAKSIIVVDNGFQARATEVNMEVVEDILERSTKDFKDK
jgi:hypothetical protein